ncbi:hypothetical protein VB780_14565 [Leptolyngbya sp. CCNP1308]|uniref:hypothetical protein n=1 Tax=Leptolyngbya sp. CCNP1308 TaxID=3110255 RepID=UPI002B20C74D|nr:hypothetical protein [Leptolyngbya sp. CCNP1308]MEA5449803.1 hypothetical protein [Leptolyngbya sp. CCNP1308]
MANSSFLTTFTRHRDPKLLWPVAAVASVLAHGLALGMVRTLAIQTPALPEGEMAPLPIQMVDLPLDSPAPEAPAENSDPTSSAEDSTAQSFSPADAAIAEAAQVAQAAAAPEPPVSPAPSRPFIEPSVTATPPPAAPPVASPPVAPAPRPTPAPVTQDPPAVAPAPPRPAAPVSPAPEVSRPPGAEGLPGVENPAPGEPLPSAPPENAAPGESEGQGGQVVPVGLRLDPNGRDIPETAPQLLDTSAIAMRPLASSCGFANLDALLAGISASSVQMQIRVEPSGEISNVRLVQGTGSSAVDDLVSCVVRQRLRLQPASSAGVAQLTDAFILEARVQF